MHIKARQFHALQLNDKFNLGSIGKVVTGTLTARLVQGHVGKLAWATRLGDVVAELWFVPSACGSASNFFL